MTVFSESVLVLTWAFREVTHGIRGHIGGLYSLFSRSTFGIHSYFPKIAMAFFKAFTLFIHELSHRVFSPLDNVVLLDTKGKQDSLCRDNITRSPSTTSDSTRAIKPHAIYDGGYENAKIQGVRLRIANGGAGQVGLIRAWADGFIQYMVSEGMQPFEVRLRHIVKTYRLNAFRWS